MLSEIFRTILLLSVSGTAVISLILLIKPFTEKRFGAVWQYYIWLAAIVVLVFPFKINLPPNTAVETSKRIYEAIGVIEHVQIKSVSFPTPDAVEKVISFNVSDIAAFLWLAITSVIMLCKIICYIFFKRELYKSSVYEFSRGRLCIRRSNRMSSPLLTGFFKPILIIPSGVTDGKELSHILTHELTHYKRWDILYKWLVVFVKSVHWFNPFVYLLAKEIDSACEISCDILLTKEMTAEEKRSYMNTVLLLIEKSTAKKSIPFASMATNKKLIKKRFEMIRDFNGIRFFARLVSVSVATAIGLSGIIAGTLILSLPVHAGKPLPEKAVTFNYKRTDPQPEPAPVIVPEDAEKTTEVEDIPSISEAQPDIAPQESTNPAIPEIKKNTVSTDAYVNMDILEFAEKIDSKTMLSLVEQSGNSYIYGEFKHEDGTQRFVSGISPDENGNITLHLSSDIDEIIQVDFWEDENQKGVWGVKIPADKGRAYSFTGFDAEKKYSIRLYSPSKENWKIDSEYIIY